MHGNHGHAHDHRHKHRHMTCQVGKPGHKIKLTTPTISGAVADVIKAKNDKCDGLMCTLKMAEQFFEAAKQSTQQAADQVKEWRKNRNEQYQYNMRAEEKLEAANSQLEQQIEEKDKIAQLGG